MLDTGGEKDYTDDFNRLSKAINASTLQSKQEWANRFDSYGLGHLKGHKKGRKFLNDWYEYNIKDYIEENVGRLEEVKKKRPKRRKWSETETKYLKENIYMKPSKLWKSSVFAGRTYASVYSKRRALLKRVLKS